MALPPNCFLPYPSIQPPVGSLQQLNIAIQQLYMAIVGRLEGLVRGAAASTFTVITAVDFGTSKVKTRSITVAEGIVTSVGAESAWT